MAEVSLDFHILRANEAYCRMLGYREEELIGKHLRDITHPESLEENLRKQSQLLAGEIDHYRLEKRFVHKSGRVIQGILDASLVRDAEGQPIYFLGSVLDITERKLAEAELEHLNLVLRAIRNVNQLITREKDRGRLVQRTCDLLIETRGYYNAWIALLDEKGRLVVPAYVRRKLGIARNALVSVVVEPVSRVKRFRAESDCDAERILEYVDDAVSYRCEGEYLEVACGRGRGRGAK